MGGTGDVIGLWDTAGLCASLLGGVRGHAGSPLVTWTRGGEEGHTSSTSLWEGTKGVMMRAFFAGCFW